MWDAIGNAIKAFVEKDLVPSIISVAVAITAILVLPEDNWMILKLGQVWIGILAFALCFLFVKFIISIARWVKNQGIKRANKRFDDEQKLKNEKKVISDLWNTVDNMSPGDRQTLRVFLDNNNTPIEESGNCYYNYDSLMSSDWIDSTIVPYKFDNQEKESTVNENGIPLTHFINQGKKRYKLKEDIFQLLKYSKDKYGKISNFDE